MSTLLNPTRALIFRIVHRDNIPWVLDNGLHCKNSNIVDSQYVQIGNPELIDKRSTRLVPTVPGRTLSDYVPFYFTPFSPMLLNITTGYGGIRKRDNAEIVLLVSSLPRLTELNIPFLFTDRHAYLSLAQYYSDLAKLDQLDWEALQNRNFKRDADHPERFERYQAEALVHKYMPINALLGIVCYNETVRSSLQSHLDARGMRVDTAVRPTWYF